MVAVPGGKSVSRPPGCNGPDRPLGVGPVPRCPLVATSPGDRSPVPVAELPTPLCAVPDGSAPGSEVRTAGSDGAAAPEVPSRPAALGVAVSETGRCVDSDAGALDGPDAVVPPASLPIACPGVPAGPASDTAPVAGADGLLDAGTPSAGDGPAPDVKPAGCTVPDWAVRPDMPGAVSFALPVPATASLPGATPAAPSVGADATPGADPGAPAVTACAVVAFPGASAARSAAAGPPVPLDNPTARGAPSPTVVGWRIVPAAPGAAGFPSAPVLSCGTGSAAGVVPSAFAFSAAASVRSASALAFTRASSSWKRARHAPTCDPS